MRIASRRPSVTHMLLTANLLLTATTLIFLALTSYGMAESQLHNTEFLRQTIDTNRRVIAPTRQEQIYASVLASCGYEKSDLERYDEYHFLLAAPGLHIESDPYVVNEHADLAIVRIESGMCNDELSGHHVLLQRREDGEPWGDVA